MKSILVAMVLLFQGLCFADFPPQVSQYVALDPDVSITFYPDEKSLGLRASDVREIAQSLFNKMKVEIDYDKTRIHKMGQGAKEAFKLEIAVRPMLDLDILQLGEYQFHVVMDSLKKISIHSADYSYLADMAIALKTGEFFCRPRLHLVKVNENPRKARVILQECSMGVMSIQ